MNFSMALRAHTDHTMCRIRTLRSRKKNFWFLFSRVPYSAAVINSIIFISHRRSYNFVYYNYLVRNNPNFLVPSAIHCIMVCLVSYATWNYVMWQKKLLNHFFRPFPWFSQISKLCPGHYCQVIILLFENFSVWYTNIIHAYVCILTEFQYDMGPMDL